MSPFCLYETSAFNPNLALLRAHRRRNCVGHGPVSRSRKLSLSPLSCTYSFVLNIPKEPVIYRCVPLTGRSRYSVRRCWRGTPWQWDHRLCIRYKLLILSCAPLYLVYRSTFQSLHPVSLGPFQTSFHASSVSQPLYPPPHLAVALKPWRQ